MTVEIFLTKGYVAIVDDEDKDLANQKWHSNIAHKRPYATRHTSKNKISVVIKLHRLIAERMLARKLLPSEFVDHIDNNSLNNCRSNLRIATISGNNRNAKLRSDNTSGYKGVDFYKRSNKWRARICVDNKLIFLGEYETQDLAYQAYCQAAEHHFKEFARPEKRK